MKGDELEALQWRWQLILFAEVCSLPLFFQKKCENVGDELEALQRMWWLILFAEVCQMVRTI